MPMFLNANISDSAVRLNCPQLVCGCDLSLISPRVVEGPREAGASVRRYHWLLVTAGDTGDLKYRDVSTGEPVVTHKTRLGPTQAMAQNPHTAVMQLGHTYPEARGV